MFDWQVASLTAGKVAELLCFIAIGYALRHFRKIPRESVAVVSTLCTWVFLPAYNILHLPQTFTVAALKENALLVTAGSLVILGSLFLAKLLGRLLGRTSFERRSLCYLFTFANYGFFGCPVLEAVFGTEILGPFIVFCIPMALLTPSYGYSLFASEKGFSVKRILFSPLLIATVLGCVLGLTGVRLPSVIQSTVTVAGGCMSSAAMLLTGLVLGSLSPKELLGRLRPYGYNLIRLAGIPLAGLAVLLLVKPLISPQIFFFAGVFLSLPAGLNCVVFPESLGLDAKDNARTCFLSFLMSVVTLPLLFSLLKVLSGMA